MRTIKLVVIGSSGVGKTSLRSQYISGRFTTGYRATIGADFITKSLPHYDDVEENITLQIWDTAGQERFSSLSSAFFRGADAALLMFDVNDPNTLQALHKWWAEFKERAPLADEDAAEFCCVVVGNKMDLVRQDFNPVTEEDAMKVIDTLVPPEEPTRTSEEPSPIDINGHHRNRRVSHSRSRSRSLLRGGTMSTSRSGFTTFHTPSSSIFDNFESARSSPTPLSRSPSPPTPIMLSASPNDKAIRRKASTSSTSSSAPTITPSLFARTRHPLPSISQKQQEPTPIVTSTPERRPKLFFTSAKTGQGVAEVFEYISQRVTKRCEYHEDIEARTLHMRDYTSDTIQLGLHERSGMKLKSCC